MAGTDRRRKGEAEDFCKNGPVIVLVEPQLGENIGMVARAMLNFGLMELRLVNPREGWSRDKAIKASSGATIVLDRAQIFESTAEAIADLEQVYATTARPRDLVKPMLSARHAAATYTPLIRQGIKCGVLFGKESKGLSNDDVALADAILHLPLNPAFASLNLAQAVLLIGYEWFCANSEVPDKVTPLGKGRPASKQDLMGFFEQLESELDASGFLRVPDKRPSMVRNIRSLFTRANLTFQEVSTLRGIISFLVHKKSFRK